MNDDVLGDRVDERRSLRLASQFRPVEGARHGSHEDVVDDGAGGDGLVARAGQLDPVAPPRHLRRRQSAAHLARQEELLALAERPRDARHLLAVRVEDPRLVGRN